MDNLKPLTNENYHPSGWTSLNDAVALAIDELSGMKDANEPDTSFLVIIISDGEENHSKEFRGVEGSKLLAGKIKARQDTDRWTFTYLGANGDLSKISKTYAIPLGNMQKFVADKAGVMHVNSVQTKGLKKYMTGQKAGRSSTTTFYGG